MDCTKNIIGYKDCNKAFRYYLDDYGISLNSASKVNDDKFTNAKAMLDTIISQSWKETFNDITFDGMQANKILNDVTYGMSESVNDFTGTKTVTLTKDDDCELGEFYLSSFTLKQVVKQQYNLFREQKQRNYIQIHRVMEMQ